MPVRNPTYYHVLLAATVHEVTSEVSIQIPTPVTVNSDIPKPRTYKDIERIVADVAERLEAPVTAFTYVGTTELEGEPYVDHTIPVAEEPKSRHTQLVLPERNLFIPGQS
jgi:hypothetical protein